MSTKITFSILQIYLVKRLSSKIFRKLKINLTVNVARIIFMLLQNLLKYIIEK